MSNLICINKKLLILIGFVLVFVFAFFLINKLSDSRITKTSQAGFFDCILYSDKNGTVKIKDLLRCCRGKTSGLICGQRTFLGGAYSIDCQNGNVKFYKSYNDCSNSSPKTNIAGIVGVGNGIVGVANFPAPTLIPTKIILPTITPQLPTNPYVMNVTLRKDKASHYVLGMDQINNGTQNHYTFDFYTINDLDSQWACQNYIGSLQELYKNFLPFRNSSLFFSNENGLKIRVQDYMTKKYVFEGLIPSPDFNGFIRIYADFLSTSQCYQ